MAKKNVTHLNDPEHAPYTACGFKPKVGDAIISPDLDGEQVKKEIDKHLAEGTMCPTCRRIFDAYGAGWEHGQKHATLGLLKALMDGGAKVAGIGMLDGEGNLVAPMPGNKTAH